MAMPEKFYLPWDQIDPSLQHGGIPGVIDQGWVGPDLGDNISTRNRDMKYVFEVLRDIAASLSMRPAADAEGPPNQNAMVEVLKVVHPLLEQRIVDVLHARARMLLHTLDRRLSGQAAVDRLVDASRPALVIGEHLIGLEDFGMLASRAEAEDAVQETFVRAYTLLVDGRSIKGNSELAWLYRIATYVCLHLLRSRRRRGEQSMEKTEHQMVVLEDGHDRKLMLRQELENLLLSLDKTGQAVLVAHYIDGIPQGEIARSLGISRRAVVKRLSVMRKKMRQSVKSEL